MKISDVVVKQLRKYAEVRPTRRVHPEDQDLYQDGLVDGMALLANEVLEQLKPDVEIPEEIKGLE